ncbi:hypothetical protein [Nocardioides sp. AE5]|uniref:hypothetical protein n=1 Tax=Nocardioides sp. AE5 TaxID=2962573 RepID=UPI0028814412|nr:hypothetical protein [Nocardioides sp. AE5]MDT0202804.1 hypothetical protein [Nocardioides sp. AE5]
MSRASRQADAEQELARARAGVIEATGPVVADLVQQVSGTLRFSQGRYNPCANDLGGPTAYSWSVRGRVDLADGAGVDPEAAVARAAELLAGHGFTIDADQTMAQRVVATRGPVRVMVECLSGAAALVFTGSDDTCFELGRERARAYAGADPDPLG